MSSRSSGFAKIIFLYILSDLIAVTLIVDSPFLLGIVIQYTITQRQSQQYFKMKKKFKNTMPAIHLTI